MSGCESCTARPAELRVNHGHGIVNVCAPCAGSELECLDVHHENGCSGSIEYHSTDPGVRPAFPRCERHWCERLDEEDRLRRTYPEQPPHDFSPLDAGEAWGENDY